MGWLFGWSNRKDLINYLVRGDGVKTLTHCCKGNVLWAVQDYTSQTTGETHRFIACYLMQGRKDSRDGWGYKDMAESMHPYYYSCPRSYLDMAPVTCQAWRDEVIKHSERGRRRFQIGEHFRYGGKGYKVVESLGRRGYIVHNDYGVPFRFRLSQVKATTTVQDVIERSNA